MKLLVFEKKKSLKMSKNWNLVKIIDLGLNFTYEFEVCYKEIEEKNCKKTKAKKQRQYKINKKKKNTEKKKKNKKHLEKHSIEETKQGSPRW